MKYDNLCKQQFHRYNNAPHTSKYDRLNHKLDDRNYRSQCNHFPNCLQCMINYFIYFYIKKPRIMAFSTLKRSVIVISLFTNTFIRRKFSIIRAFAALTIVIIWSIASFAF